MKELFSNPIALAFLALVVALIAVIAAFVNYVTAPDLFGVSNVDFDSEHIYYFADDWSLAYDYLEISFAPGTLVVPAYHQGQVIAVLMIAPDEYPGQFRLILPEEHRGMLPPTITGYLEQALILLDYNIYKRTIRDSGETILLRTDEPDIPKRYLHRQMQAGQSILAQYQLFGLTNFHLPRSQTVVLQLWTERMGSFTYYEDTLIQVIGPDFEVEFVHPEIATRFYPPADYECRVALYLLSLGLAAAAIVTCLTAGLDNKPMAIRGEYHPLWTTLVIALALVYSWLLAMYQQAFLVHPFWMTLLWGLPLVLIGTWAYHSHLPLAFFGLCRHGLRETLLIAPIVSGFLILGSSFTLPTNIDSAGSLAISLLLAAVLREAFLRGFVQRILSHWLSPWVGIVTVAVAWTLITGFNLVNPQPLAVLPLLSSFVTSFLAGYTYYRTNNILAPGLLMGLLELAAQCLIF